ncbi:MAG: N-6 DNA methylase [Pseudonocardiaceae bacterium]
MNAFEDSLPMTEVARLAEVGVTAVSNWRKRHIDFPSARRSSGQELFAAGEIAQWLDGRKISKKDLKPGESPSTTYGDRFLRNLRTPDAAAPAAEDVTKPRPMSELGQQLWAALDRVRGSYDVGSYAELVLGLLYLRVREAELWQQLIREPSGDVVHGLLVRATLPANPHVPRVPLFRTVAQTPRDDRSLVEMVHAINQIDLSGSGGATSAAARLGDYLLTQLERAAGKRGEHFTPDSLVGCMVGLANPQSQDRVYDPFCRSGELLAAAVAHVERSGGDPEGMSFSGQVLSEASWQLTKLNAALHGADVDLGARPSSALHDDVHPGRRFDVVLANPPFNMSHWAGRGGDADSRWSYGVPPAHNANFAWLQHVARKLAPGGRAAVLMSNMTTTSENPAEAAIRARMVDAGVVDCVMALPPQLFRSTGIPVSLWILRGVGEKAPPEILFIDATGLGAMTDRVQRILTDEDLDRIFMEYRGWCDGRSAGKYGGTSGFAKSVKHTEIRERDYLLNPRVYVEPVPPEVYPERSLEAIKELRADLDDLRARSLDVRAELDAQLAGIVAGHLPRNAGPEKWTRVSLGEVCDVLAGPGTVDRGEYRPSWVPVVLPRNIKHNRITDDELDAVEPQTASKLSRYRLAPGDVVCTRTGELGRNALAAPAQADWLLGPGCMRLRPTDRVDAGYLTYYLGSSVAYAWLLRNATGSAIRNLSTKTLRRMPLVLPSLPVQSEIGAVLGMLDSEIAIHRRLGATTQVLRDLLLPLLMAGTGTSSD